jgi:hypothetical protein
MLRILVLIVAVDTRADGIAAGDSKMCFFATQAWDRDSRSFLSKLSLG